MVAKLFYKEWIKTRWAALVCLILGFAAVFYSYLEVHAGVREGAWGYLMNVIYPPDFPTIYWSLLRYVPFLSAIAIGLTQFVPEAAGKRIKLTFHLPFPPIKATYLMVLFGLGLVSGITLIVFGSFFAWNLALFPKEISVALLPVLLPWLMGGVATYFLIALVAMEPQLKFQCIFGVLAVGIANLYWTPTGLGAGWQHDTNLPWLAAILLSTSSAILFSSHRFMKGEH